VNQRGHIALYLVFSLATASAVGYGVYAFIRDQAKAERARPARRAPTTAVPVRAPVPEVEPPPAPEPEVDIAERDAIDPEDIDDPDKDTVLLGKPGVAGALEVAQVERMIRRYSGRYDRCMRRARERYRLRRGQLRLAFVIGGNGAVAGVTAKATVQDEIADCVMDTVKKLRFDKPADGALVKVVYPMLFVPAHGGDAGDPLPSPEVLGIDDPLVE
jgi:outer membrane biosynthesis protein TonB